MDGMPIPAYLQLGMPLVQIPLLHGSEDIDEWESGLHRLLRVMDLQAAILIMPQEPPGPFITGDWSRKRDLVNLILHQSLSYPPVRAALRIHGWSPWETEPTVTVKLVVNIYKPAVTNDQLLHALRNMKYALGQPLEDYLLDLCGIQKRLDRSIPEKAYLGDVLAGLANAFPLSTVEWTAQLETHRLDWNDLMRQLFWFAKRIKRGDRPL